MHDALLGRFCQGRGHLPHDRQRMGQIGRAMPGDVVAEVLALHVFLGDVVQVIDAADLVDLHDVGVDQRGGRLGLELESLEVGSIAGQLRLEDLDGHAPLEAFLLGQIDFGHRPAAQAPQQMEVAQATAGKIGVGDGSAASGVGDEGSGSEEDMAICWIRSLGHGHLARVFDRDTDRLPVPPFHYRRSEANGQPARSQGQKLQQVKLTGFWGTLISANRR